MLYNNVELRIKCNLTNIIFSKNLTVEYRIGYCICKLTTKNWF